MGIRILNAMCRRHSTNHPVNFHSFQNILNNASFLNGTSSEYIEYMYNDWLLDPSKVHASWNPVFRKFSDQSMSVVATPKETEVLVPNPVAEQLIPHEVPQFSSNHREYDSAYLASLAEHQEVHTLVNAYQFNGHNYAKLDPLDISNNYESILDGFPMEDKDLDKFYNLSPQWTHIAGKEKSLSLREIIRRLEEVYCGSFGVEFMHIPDFKPCDWIMKHIESPGIVNLTLNEKLLLIARLIESSEFETFLAKKFPSEKRFGLEGCESLIPALNTVIDKSTENGVENFIIGMAHRGRLNVLANVCRKQLFKIFSQFHSLDSPGESSGDVKYHLGSYTERTNTATSKTMRISIVSNPSHLEMASAVVLGRTRAEQFFRGDCGGEKTLAILLHGDAAFSGQGMVYETFNFSNLPAHTTHGTIHIVVNNQIGFTTDPRFSRSSPHCTDVARVVNAPIFHVNSDDPEKVIYMSKLTADYRAKFRADAVLDIVCYRRNGHNEADDPSFTQPLMYQKIRAIPPILNLYSQKLIAEGLVTEEYLKDATMKYEKHCEEEFLRAKKEKLIINRDWIESPWSSFFSNSYFNKIQPTGITETVVAHIGKIFSSPPHLNEQDFDLHKGLKRILNARMKLTEARQLDWSLGEAVAFGSLLRDGIHVRLSGQDVERGTFSHRHHVLHHQTVDKATHNPLCHLYPDQASYVVCNSSLSEYGNLAFELGYSLSNPKALVIWEAQFGDFANNAQSIIDTMIASGESKWIRQCGLVLMLPHGMEGQGPEHSSARLERFLQLSEENPDTFPSESEDFVFNQLRKINWIVANCTTPANLCHILRRQMAMPFRKPLILLTPKSLLRHPEVRSSFDDILDGTEFKPVISDEGKDPCSVKKLIFCSGKVYYDLKNYFKEKNVESTIAVVRIEQLCPFPIHMVKKECDKYPQAEISWCQEEHKNQGGWAHMRPRIETAVAGKRRVQYIGRAVSASTATGNKVKYLHELNDFLEKAADWKKSEIH